MFKYFPIFLVTCFLGMSTSVFSVEYSADMLKAFWESKSSKTACDLTQPIPNYGEAFFSIRPEEPLQFGIYQSRSPGFAVSQASLSALPAPWRHEFSHLKNYPVYIEQRAQSKYFSVFGVDAETMIDVLLATDFPTFTYINVAQGKTVEEVRVTVSAVNFLPSYQDFMTCRQDLLPYAMPSLQDKVVYFAEKSTRIESELLTNIEKIVDYMKEIQETRVVLASDTHSVGNKADATLFKPRAQKIADFLVKKGIEASRIFIRPEFLPEDLEGNGKTFRIHVFGPDVLKLFWFHKGSTHLTAKEQQRLDLVALYMQYQVEPLIINSHTDGMGRKANNQVVSQKRGDAIKRYLYNKGVPEEKLIVRAYGERKPVASNRTRKGQAKNRRVELGFAH